MKKHIECKNCNSSLVLTENELFFSEEKELETVNCPICETKVFEGKTDGWFFIQTLDKEKLDNNSKNKLTYPMP